MNISPPFGEFMALLCHILPIHNITVNSNNLFVNFCWTFTFFIEKPYDESTSHLAGHLIGSAISYMSRSNKAGSTTVK
jgi:hypothetical protein